MGQLVIRLHGTRVRFLDQQVLTHGLCIRLLELELITFATGIHRTQIGDGW